MFTAKSASPLDTIGPYPYPAFEQAAERKLTYITAPPGSLLADSLAGTIVRKDRPLVWLRLGIEDSDPATILLSIIAAVQRLRPDFGAETVVAMRARPGPVFSWPPLFTNLGHELHEMLDPATVLVFENLENLAARPETLRLLYTHLLPLLPERASSILISNQRLSSPVLPKEAYRCDIKELVLDNQARFSLAELLGVPLPSRYLPRLATLSEGLPEVLVSICTACNLLGNEYLAKELERTKSANELLENIAHALIAQTDSQTQQVLGLLVQIGYSHPSLVGNSLQGSFSVDDPWFQQLTEDWERFRRFWRPLLQRNLSTPSSLPSASLVDHFGSKLIAQGALPQAVRLYQWAGDTNSIGREVSRQAVNLLDLGQWETLLGWIDELPASTLESYPALLLYRGQISAARGDFENSAKTFTKAVKFSSTQSDFTTACQGLLASCVVQSRLGRYDQALVTAMNLVSMATQHNLDRYRGWALWQIGTIWTILGRLDQAAAYFEQAMHWISEAAIVELLAEVREIVTAQQENQQLVRLHTRVIQEAQRKEEENATRLAAILNSPSPSLEVLLKQYGWSGVPSPMSFPHYLTKSSRDSLGEINFWQKLLLRYASLRKSRGQELIGAAQAPALSAGAMDAEMAERLLSLMSVLDGFLSFEADRENEKVADDPQLRSIQASDLPLPVQIANPVYLEQQLRQPVEPAAGSHPEWMLTAYFLGSFRIFLNDAPVDVWPSGRGRSLCKYLLVNRQRPIPREKLMDVFWPSVTPDLARNSLNVAVHDLRQAFRAVTDQAVVEYDEGAYLLNPAVDVWVDVEAFAHHLQASRQYAAAHRDELAIKELELATSLYQGDFLADDPYEDWTILTRERLRMDYLEILDRLSHAYFRQGDYVASASLCQLILNRDNCREDAHRLLMYCYSRQGQQYLALRQYHICCEALHSELQIEPEPATIELVDRIRRHENV